MKKILSAGLLLLFLAPLVRADDTPLLPPSNLAKGWVRSRPAKVFTSSDLYGYIDGGAEIFLEYGFERLTVQQYVSGKTGEITLEIYRMTDPVAAQGIYLMKCGEEHRDSSFAEIHTLSKYQMLVRRASFLLNLTNRDGDARAVPVMLAFCRYITGKLGPNGDLRILDLLPREGMVSHSLRIFRGPYSLQSYNPLSDKNIFLLNKSVAAVGAEYRAGPGEPETLIRIPYPDTLAADRAFRYARSQVDTSVRILTQSDESFAFRDYRNRFGLLRRAREIIEIRANLSALPAEEGAR